MTGLFRTKPNPVVEKKKRLRKLVRAKKYDEALDVAGDILRKAPQDYDVNFIVGAIYHMRHRYRQAISYFERSLEIGQYDTEALLLKADSHHKLGQRRDCQACCKKILEVDPKNASALELLKTRG